MRGDECSDLSAETDCECCVTVAAAVTRGGAQSLVFRCAGCRLYSAVMTVDLGE